MKNMNIGFIFAIGAAMIWGLAYAIDQKILSNISPITLLFISSLLAAIITLPFIISSSNNLKGLMGSGKTILLLIIVSGILTTLANFLIFSSIKNLNASLASIIEIAYPFFVVLFSFIFFRSSLNIYFFIGGMLIFIGSIIIIKFA
jgi:drug/metabolite transporter (DMT)-like permease